MVTMAVLLCTSKVLQLEHYASRDHHLEVHGLGGWKGERTMSTLNTVMVLLLIVYLQPDGVVRVSREPAATDDPLVVLLMQNNPHKKSASFHNFLSNHYARKQGPMWDPRQYRV
jgi:hypothetical protein